MFVLKIKGRICTGYDGPRRDGVAGQHHPSPGQPRVHPDHRRLTIRKSRQLTRLFATTNSNGISRRIVLTLYARLDRKHVLAIPPANGSFIIHRRVLSSTLSFLCRLSYIDRSYVTRVKFVRKARYRSCLASCRPLSRRSANKLIARHNDSQR